MGRRRELDASEVVETRQNLNPVANLNHSFADASSFLSNRSFCSSMSSQIDGHAVSGAEQARAASEKTDSGTAEAAPSDSLHEPTEEERARDAAIWETFRIEVFSAGIVHGPETFHAEFQAVLKRPDVAILTKEDIEKLADWKEFEGAYRFYGIVGAVPDKVRRLLFMFFRADASSLCTEPPETILANVSLSVFRESFPTLRGLISMRESELPKGSAIRAEMGQRIKTAFLLLSQMVISSSGVRERLAIDVQLLDSVARWTKTIVDSPEVYLDGRGEAPLLNQPMILDYGLRIIFRAGIQSSKRRFKAHLLRKKQEGQQDFLWELLKDPASKVLSDDISCDWRPETRKSFLMTHFQILSTCCMDPEELPYELLDHNAMHAALGVLDGCDQCRSEPKKG
jgi:hypothetical protein